MIWGCLADKVTHFNQFMPFQDLVTAGCNDIIQFPTTNLHRFAERVGDGAGVSLMSFPREWQSHIDRLERGSYGTYNRTGMGGGYVVGVQPRITDNTKTKDPDHDKSRDKGKGGDNSNREQSFKQLHSTRYQFPAVNSEVDPTIKETLEGLKEFTFADIEAACEKSHYHYKQWDAFKEGICPAFATGKCIFPRCTARHLLGKETPKHWVKTFCTKIKPGIQRIKKGEDIPRLERRKRKRGGN